MGRSASRQWYAVAALAAALAFGSAAHAADPVREPVFGIEVASADVRQIALWVISTGDNKGLPFAIVDKTAAKVFAIDPQGRVIGATSALLGLTIGDTSPAGIGSLPLSAITPEQRITPAGRFVAELGEDQAGKSILWIDYDAAIALHPVVTSNAAEHRLSRLNSPSPLDKRISYGCINVPAAFFQTVVAPLFQKGGGIVYILPEKRSIAAVFFKGLEVAAR